MSYVDGFVIAVPEKNIEAYRKIAEKAGRIWMEHGALAYKECVGEDMQIQNFEGLTFPVLANTKAGETVVFAFIVFKSREHRDEVNAKVMADERLNDDMDPNNMPFEIQRMAYGGFKSIVEF